MVVGGCQGRLGSSPFCSECQLHAGLHGATDPLCPRSRIADGKVCITGLDRRVGAVFVFHTQSLRMRLGRRQGAQLGRAMGSGWHRLPSALTSGRSPAWLRSPVHVSGHASLV